MRLYDRKGFLEDIEFSIYFIYLLEIFVFLFFFVYNIGKIKKLDRFINILYIIISNGNIFICNIVN